jgi:hypothetical protein
VHRAAAGEAVRSLTGRSLRLAYELRDLPSGDEPPEPPPLTPDELVERLVAEFDAEEIDPDEEGVE